MLHLAFAAWLAGAGADLVTTYDTSAHYQGVYQRADGSWYRVQESNPLYSGLSGHPAIMTATIAASDVATAWVIHKWVTPHHPKVAAWLYVGMASRRVTVATQNYRIMRQADSDGSLRRVY